MILYYIVVLSLAFVDHPIFGLGFGRITVVKLVGAAALLYAIVHLAWRRTTLGFVHTWPARAFLAFFLLSLGSYLAFGRDVATDQVFTFHAFNFLLLLFITGSAVDSLSRLRCTLLAAVGSIAWASLYMLREWQVGVRFYGYSYRPGYVVGDSNYFASSALLCLPMAFYFARSMPKRWMRWGCAASVLLILAAITVSGSRGGFLGLVAVALMMVWYSGRRFRTFLVVTALVGVFLIVLPVSPLDRLLHPTGSDQGTTEIRIALWKAAWSIFFDHPMAGVGYGNSRYALERYALADLGHNYVVHNQYLEVLLDMGVPGLLAYCGMYVGSFVSLARVRRTAKRAGSHLLFDAALGIQIGLIGFGLSVFFISAHFLKLFWFMVSISACMPALPDAAIQPASLEVSTDGRSTTGPSRDTVAAGLQLEFGE